MSELGEALSALKAVLEKHSDGWYVFGGQAVIVRGAPRATVDVDVTVALGATGIETLRAALRSAGLTDRHPDAADDLLARSSVLALRHDPSGFEVDIVVAGSGIEALVMSRATVVPIAGVDVPVAQATDLVVMKVLAGRGKDLDDVRGLLAGGEVDVDQARDLLRQLEQALDRSDLLSVLERAITEVDPS